MKYDIINNELINKVVEKARNSERQRTTHCLHQVEDPAQRMIFAIEPGSYCQPHKHVNPVKNEAFVCLRGKFAIMIFDDDGQVIEAIICGGENLGVDIKPDTWHSLIGLEPGTVAFEVKDGPYDPETDKNFASWAPAEGSPEADAYLESLEEKI